MFVAFGLILVLSAGVANYFISGSFDLVTGESVQIISALYAIDVLTSMVIFSFLSVSNEAGREYVRLSRLYFLFCLIPVFGVLILSFVVFLWAIKSAFLMEVNHDKPRRR